MISGIPRPLLALALAVVAGAAVSCGNSGPLHVPLTVQGNIQMPHDVTSNPLFDLLTLDPRRGFLYVAHESASAIEIVDVRSNKVVGSVPGIAAVKQVALSADPNLIFASAGASGSIAVVDVDARKVLGSVPVNGSPDAIEYDPVHDYVVATSAGAKELTAINPTTRKVIGTVPLPGAPELMTIDSKSGRAFVNINDLDEVAVVDLGTMQVTSLFKGCDIKAPTGVAYDPDQNRLFVADRGLVSVIDVLIDKCLGAIDIGNGVDQIALNPHRHHLYTANGGSRNLSVIDVVSLKPLGEVGTGPSGDGVAVDPTTDKVYVMVGRAGIVAVYHDP